MTDGIVVTVTRDPTYPRPDEQVYRYEKPKDQAPWSDTIAASMTFAPEVWELLGSPEHIRLVIRPF